jgi:hypothetical protein
MKAEEIRNGIAPWLHFPSVESGRGRPEKVDSRYCGVNKNE